jgi:hypothetical protein
MSKESVQLKRTGSDGTRRTSWSEVERVLGGLTVNEESIRKAQGSSTEGIDMEMDLSRGRWTKDLRRD